MQLEILYQIFWSDVLPRHTYFEEEIVALAGIIQEISILVLIKVLRNLEMLMQLGILCYRLLHFRFFLCDFWHLSVEGNELLRKKLSAALVFFNENPDAFRFHPPKNLFQLFLFWNKGGVLGSFWLVNVCGRIFDILGFL